eukprot:1822553-Pleurochrysis_carterae.AAC.1
MGSKGALLAATDIKPHSTSILQRKKSHASPSQESCTSCTHPNVSQINNPSAKLKHVRSYVSMLTGHTDVLASS